MALGLPVKAHDVIAVERAQRLAAQQRVSAQQPDRRLAAHLDLRGPRREGDAELPFRVEVGEAALVEHVLLDLAAEAAQRVVGEGVAFELQRLEPLPRRVAEVAERG